MTWQVLHTIKVKEANKEIMKNSYRYWLFMLTLSVSGWSKLEKNFVKASQKDCRTLWNSKVLTTSKITTGILLSMSAGRFWGVTWYNLSIYIGKYFYGPGKLYCKYKIIYMQNLFLFLHISFIIQCVCRPIFSQVQILHLLHSSKTHGNDWYYKFQCEHMQSGSVIQQLTWYYCIFLWWNLPRVSNRWFGSDG